MDPDLVVRDKEGKPYTVRYEAVNAMLLNEFSQSARLERDCRWAAEANRSAYRRSTESELAG